MIYEDICKCFLSLDIGTPSLDNGLPAPAEPRRIQSTLDCNDPNISTIRHNNSTGSVDKNGGPIAIISNSYKINCRYLIQRKYE